MAYIMSLEDTSDWTFEQWLSAVWYYQTYIFPVISQGQEFTNLDAAASMFGMTREQLNVLKNRDVSSLNIFQGIILKLQGLLQNMKMSVSLQPMMIYIVDCD